MSKESDYLHSYPYLDSQRLRDTFFSPPPPKPSSKQIIFLSSVIISLITLLSILFFLLRYDVIVIPRSSVKLNETSASLFHPHYLSSVHILGEDKQLKEVKRSPIYSTVPSQEKIGMRIILKKTINLKNNALLLSIKNAKMPLKIGIVVRDARCFSNSLHPFIVETQEIQGTSYVQIPIVLDDVSLQNTNLYRINQVSLYFYPQYKEELNWVLVKDIWVVKKNQLLLNGTHKDSKYIYPENTPSLVMDGKPYRQINTIN